MKEHPILFSTDMVRAILDGRKTVTRRVIKGFIPEDAEFGFTAFTPDGHISVRGDFCGKYGEKFVRMPCAVVDRLWVREAFAEAVNDIGLEKGMKQFWLYKADYDCDTLAEVKRNSGKWRPSIHMPRKASRITLEVVSVRAERLQDITEDDAIAEGVTPVEVEVLGQGVTEFSHRLAFEGLWDSLYAKRGIGWDAKPWVWRVEFRRVDV